MPIRHPWDETPSSPAAFAAVLTCRLIPAVESPNNGAVSAAPRRIASRAATVAGAR